jgi:hypothetical protein
MRTLLLVLAVLTAPAVAAGAQETDAPDGTRIAIADVSGIPVDQLSAPLRADIDALVGTTIMSERLAALVTRIEDEKPDAVAAARRTLQPDGDAHVTFVVARINDDPELLANINARYVIESVSVAGSVREEFFKQPVRDQLHAVVGQRLDPQEAERLTHLLASNLPRLSGFEVKRRFERGSQQGQIRLIFDVSLSGDWGKDMVMLGGPLAIPRQPKIVYHAYQGWSALVNFPITINRTTLSFGLAIANEDDLLEQYSGFRFRFGRTHVGTNRLGVSVDVSRFTQSWRDATLSAVAADSSIPAPYEKRVTLDPRVTIKPIRSVGLTAGLLLASLDPLGVGASAVDSAAILGASTNRQWITGGARHYVSAGYELHAASSGTSSDYDYTRHQVSAAYDYTQRRNGFHAKWLFGRARGDVPMFERFALGDTNTLRGWNKFDLSPAGGTRMFHQSLEYRYGVAGVFLDAGSVWTATGSADTKYSIGAGLQDFRGFLTIAVPLQADDRRVVFMMGLRF